LLCDDNGLFFPKMARAFFLLVIVNKIK
jgi:hypothetical protein